MMNESSEEGVDKDARRFESTGGQRIEETGRASFGDVD